MKASKLSTRKKACKMTPKDAPNAEGPRNPNGTILEEAGATSEIDGKI
jgi:hypothetical protein